MTGDPRLTKLGITLPAPPRPLGEYVAVKQIGRLAFLSGMLPLVEGRPAYTGAVSKEQAREAAKLATMNALAVLQAHLGTLGRVSQVVRAAVYIACPPDFQDHAFVADGCSALLNQAFPDTGRHARLAFGVTSLPMNVPVELELIFEISE
jgi:enamine deaminase RidA (YjgF/YER057c/UK114 family)